MRKKPTMLKCGRVSEHEFLVRNTFLFIGIIRVKSSVFFQICFQSSTGGSESLKVSASIGTSPVEAQNTNWSVTAGEAAGSETG